ncbi:MAG TPA: protein kinase [Blastocatellia bacterium]|nr:protein kinase [Blastocatellia bacterium]
MKGSLSANTTLSHYVILSQLGAGGMGEVWRARDTRLDREVAIKVLPADFAQDADRLRRFEQEARATSALNHPNILTVYDIGSREGSPYIVAELLEGNELRDVLNGGAIPQRKVIDYAQQIASGLAAAHSKAIVHRDLKPENIFITTDGRVKILDFGLAKLSPPTLAAGASSEVATQKAITDPGTVMGTVGYMSPEQVRGQAADHRSDIFSFGAILYELLLGRRAFIGDSAIEVMNAILKEEPEELTETNSKINPPLERIVHRCLEKKPERRFQSASDLCFAIESLSMSSGSRIGSAVSVPEVAETAGIARLFHNARLAWIAAAIFFVALLAAMPLAISHLRHAPQGQAGAVRFSIATEKASVLGQLAVSPDGRALVFAAINKGFPQLWLRSLGDSEPRPLAGTEGVNGFPFWSPDSRSICFPASGKLKKLDLSDGTVQTLWTIPPAFGGIGAGGAGAVRSGLGGTWSREGTILTFRGSSGIFRIPASGGEPAPVRGVDQPPEGVFYRWPCFLPDGDHFLYLMTTTAPPAPEEKSEVYVASLEGKGPKRLFSADSNAIYAPAPEGRGYLLFAREGALMAQSFDANSLTLSGDPYRVADHVRVNLNNRAFISVSDNGVLAYDSTPFSTPANQLVWVDRQGKQLETIPATGTFQMPSISPDGKRLAVSRFDRRIGNSDIYVVDLVRGTSSRLTLDPAADNWPVWSPDGTHIAWGSNRSGAYQIYQKLASGAGDEEQLLKSNKVINPTDWSSDGRYILYREMDPDTKADLWILPVEGDRKPIPFQHGPFTELQGCFSPDGRWIAYSSDESGSLEVYVQAFTQSGATWPVSTKGGFAPLWRRDGKELYYLSSDAKLMEVDIETAGTFEPGIPRALFDLSGTRRLPLGYAVASDGQRFLFISVSEEAGPSSLAVVVNWTAELKK